MATTGDFRQTYREMTTPQLVSEPWATEKNKMVRDVIVGMMTEREAAGDAAAFPSGAMANRETMAGLYPDPDDPQFAARLFSKREFYEARAVAAQIQEGQIDPCNSTAADAVFTLTPVQRIVSRFLHPLTPYMGMLLFHGVGVGKTCSGVTIAEQFLEHSPHKVILLVPHAIQENFIRTIFDVSKLVWDEAAGQWSSRQCTGTSYLERLGLMRTKDLKTIQYQIDVDRRKRYTIAGYQQFAIWIEKTLRSQISAGLTDPVARAAAENEILRRIFSDHLIIVDEAHNLRDTEEAGVAAMAATLGDDEAPAAGEAAENKAGKALNPYLRRIVMNAEGLRLVFMSATPMYNSAPEITLLLNYLLMNDTKSDKNLLLQDQLFTKEGDLRADASTVPLERAARRYVSYMRGENPYTFPIRIRPESAPTDPASLWPTVSATKNPVVLTEDDVVTINAMPLVFTEPEAGSPPESMLRYSTRRAAQAEDGEGKAGEDAEGFLAPEAVAVPTSDAMLDLRIQMANITYPNSLYGTVGWDNYFTRQKLSTGGRTLFTFSPKAQEGGPFNVDSVFAGEGLRRHAPKMHTIVNSVTKAKGICFAYSRYIKSGALPLAIALERAGFQRRMPDGRLIPLLSGTPAAPPICALCGERDGAAHRETTDGHPFHPACYVLLTSDSNISPDFPGLIRTATSWPNDPKWGPLGAYVKVIIGSQVASEGLDLKCIREMHVMDSWYHLNRIDQIIGRAIRYCSHAALRGVEKWANLPPLALNNCLIYLHALRVADFETADMYAYRLAIRKAQAVGKVQRLLKRHAWDCNLELEAIVFAGLPKRLQLDAQGRHLEDYSPDDQDYTTYCDYQVCKHSCAIDVPRTVEEGLQLDSSTFSVSDARRIVLAKQDAVRRLFQDQVMVPETVVQDIYADLPWEISSEALMELLDGRRFRVKHGDTDGFLVKKAGYLVFQPVAVGDTDIPLSMRYGRAFQLRRKFMEPRTRIISRGEEVPVAAVAAPKVPVLVPGTGEEEGKEGEVPAAIIPSAVEDVLKKWTDWLNYVKNDGKIKGMFGPQSPIRIWMWIFDHFRTIPEIKPVALRWWFEKALTYAEQKALYEYVMVTPDAQVDPELLMTLQKDIFRIDQISAYRIYNPESQSVEFICLTTGTTEFKKCISSLEGIVDKRLGNTPVRIPDEVGNLFGFLAPKKGKIVFKTLDTTKPKKHSSVGAECGNTSNLGEHHPRIRMLHTAAKTQPELAPFIILDDDTDWDEAGAKARIAAVKPVHMKDITHQPLCIYMEFLTRLLDARKVQGRRWFLDSVAATQSGLKSKKL